jgi:hypothetical protein
LSLRPRLRPAALELAFEEPPPRVLAAEPPDGNVRFRFIARLRPMSVVAKYEGGEPGVGDVMGMGYPGLAPVSVIGDEGLEIDPMSISLRTE